MIFKTPNHSVEVAVLVKTLEVDYQTSFLCLKSLSYTQRHLLQVCIGISRAREDCSAVFSPEAHASHGMPANSFFKSSGLLLDQCVHFLIEK